VGEHVQPYLLSIEKSQQGDSRRYIQQAKEALPIKEEILFFFAE
jgi:hypothetical protein